MQITVVMSVLWRSSDEKQPGTAPNHSRPPADPGAGPVTTIAELFRDWYFRQTAHVHGARRDGPGRDWRLIRAAEANSRQTGMRASIRTRPPPGPRNTPPTSPGGATGGASARQHSRAG